MNAGSHYFPGAHMAQVPSLSTPQCETLPPPRIFPTESTAIVAVPEPLGLWPNHGLPQGHRDQMDTIIGRLNELIELQRATNLALAEFQVEVMALIRDLPDPPWNAVQIPADAWHLPDNVVQQN